MELIGMRMRPGITWTYAQVAPSIGFNVISVRALRRLSADDTRREFKVDQADILRRFLAKSWIALDASGSRMSRAQSPPSLPSKCPASAGLFALTS
jgi:hypothetical protein